MQNSTSVDQLRILESELMAVNELLTVQEKVVSEQSTRLDDDAHRIREALDALQESERRYRDLLGSINDIVWETDADGTISYVNPSPLVAQLLGYTADELLGKPIWDLFSEEDAVQAREMLGISNSICLFECSIQRKDGTLFTGQSNCVGVLDSSGLLTGYRCVTRDVSEWKRIEQALEQSERRYREILESISDIVWEMNPDHVITYVNQRVTEVLGYTPRELTGMRTTDLASSADVSRSSGLLESTGKVDLLEVPCRRKDGRKIVLQISIRPTRDSGGSITGFKCVGRDITEQKAAEAQLKASEVNFRTIFNSVDEAIIIYDMDNQRITNANEAAVVLFDRTQDEMAKIGLELFDSGEEDYSAETALQMVMKAVKDGAHRFEWKMKHRSGQPLWMDVSLQHVSLGGRDVMLGVNQDITKKKQAEEALRISEANYRTIFNSVNEAIFFHDAQTGEILGINQSTIDMLGYSFDELSRLSVGQFSENAPPYSDAEAIEWIHKAATEGPQQFEWKLRNRSGKVFWSEVGLKHATLSGRDVVLAVVQNIQERKQAEESLARNAQDLADSNADLQQFAYAASHDLQEPLRAVASYVQLLERRYKGKLDPDADEFIGFITDGANRMREMISSLLEFSRVGTRGKAFQTIDVELALQQALLNLMIAVSESHAKITHDPLPVIHADYHQIAQLFQNLIGNAIKFRGDAPPEIHISAVQDGSFWVFSVADNGIGISPENLQRLFQVFVRLDNGRDRPGTGMGLAICKRIAERHNGDIWVESILGNGSVFHFRIPQDLEVGDGSVT